MTFWFFIFLLFNFSHGQPEWEICQHNYHQKQCKLFHFYLTNAIWWSSSNFYVLAASKIQLRMNYIDCWLSGISRAIAIAFDTDVSIGFDKHIYSLDVVLAITNVKFQQSLYMKYLSQQMEWKLDFIAFDELRIVVLFTCSRKDKIKIN